MAIDDVIEYRYYDIHLRHKAPRFVDVEICIPRVCILQDPLESLLDRIDEDVEIAKITARMQRKYERQTVAPRKDKWWIVITDGPQCCPACMGAASPEAQAEEAG
jgi:hypothetical protein